MESPESANDFEKNKLEAARVLHEYQETFDLWGHGVSTGDVAEKIIKEGLHTSWRALHDVSYKISENQEVMLNQLSGWDYNARKFIILIASPKGMDFTDYGGFEVRQKSIAASQAYIFQPSNDADNLIPREKIIGYLDTNTFQFIPNSDFADKT